jgi:hypothetical protein
MVAWLLGWNTMRTVNLQSQQTQVYDMCLICDDAFACRV